jgi:PleD family two-component response regulator
LRFSVGVAPFDMTKEQSIAEMITVADHAMYVNKRAGREARERDPKDVLPGVLENA